MSLRQSIALLAGRVTSSLPIEWDDAVWRTLRLAKAIPMWRLSGTTQAGVPGSMILGGVDPQEAYLPQRFFAESPRCETLAPIPPWNLRQTLKTLRRTADLTAIQLDRILARPILTSDYILVPEWVRSRFPVPERIESLATGHNSLRQDLRLIRKYGYTFLESHAEEDFSAFYETIYQPHGLTRHGPKAQLRSRRHMHDSFKRGGLLWVMHEKQRVGGIIVELNQKIGKFAGVGAVNGNEELLKKGILSAAYYYGIQYAGANGCTQIDLGATRPCVLDGLMNYKRKWGARPTADVIGKSESLVYWPAANASVLAMLKSTPLLTLQKGKLVLFCSESADPLEERVLAGIDRIERIAARAAVETAPAFAIN